MNKAKEKLEQIRQYKDNWNGFGAKAYTEMFMKFASDVVDSLPVEPEVFPLANAGMQLIIDSRDKINVCISLNEDFTIDVALSDCDDLIWVKKNIARKELPHMVATFISVKEPSEFPRM